MVVRSRSPFELQIAGKYRLALVFRKRFNPGEELLDFARR